MRCEPSHDHERVLLHLFKNLTGTVWQEGHRSIVSEGFRESRPWGCTLTAAVLIGAMADDYPMVGCQRDRISFRMDCRRRAQARVSLVPPAAAPSRCARPGAR